MPASIAVRVEEIVLSVELPEVCKADVAAPDGKGKATADTGCVAGKFETDTVPEIVGVPVIDTEPPVCCMGEPSVALIVCNMGWLLGSNPGCEFTCAAA